MNQAGSSWIEQLKPVLETLNQGVVINDVNGCVVFANGVFQEMLGLPPENFLGRPVANLYPSEDVPKLLNFVEKRKAAGRSLYEFHLPLPDGRRLPVLVTARSVESPDGQPFAIVTVTDISEQKRVQAELRHANELLAARQREIEEELQLAARVQQSLAPQSLSWGAVSIETFYQPVRSIGGDFGLVSPSEDHVDLFVCDVSGHGIGSALVANRIYTEAAAQIESGAKLGAVMRHLNRFAIRNLNSAAFYFTSVGARIDRGARSLKFAGAGHPPVVVIRNGEEPLLLESQSPILGLFEDAVSEQTSNLPLFAGDRVVLYTDGFTESFSATREMLGVEGMTKIVQDAARLPLAQMKQQILDRVTGWRAGPAADDMSLVVAEIR